MQAFETLAQDASEDIVIHLPITHFLVSTALASSTLLAPPILASFSFAKKHWRHQLALSRLSFYSFFAACASAWSSLAKHSNSNSGFSLLPKTYQCAIFSEIITGAFPLHESSLDHDQNHYSLFLKYWLPFVSPQQTLSLTRSLLSLETRQFDPSCMENRILRWSIQSNNLDMVQLLLQDHGVDPSVFYNSPIRAASKSGNLPLTRLLLQHPKVDPTALNNAAIQKAAEFGHFEVVELLLGASTRVDPSVNGDYCLRMAVDGGFLETVRVLLKDGRVDMWVNGGVCFGMAKEKGFEEILKLLEQTCGGRSADIVGQDLFVTRAGPTA
ncbi:UNVERIFIED_CONTAM: hypothetical protein HDU68_000750, partial [Siphonaria sp. JEL0065]